MELVDLPQVFLSCAGAHCASVPGEGLKAQEKGSFSDSFLDSSIGGARCATDFALFGVKFDTLTDPHVVSLRQLNFEGFRNVISVGRTDL